MIWNDLFLSFWAELPQNSHNLKCIRLIWKKVHWFTCIVCNLLIWMNIHIILYDAEWITYMLLENTASLCVNSKKASDEEVPRRKTQYSAQSGRIIPVSSWGGKKRSSRTSHKRAQRWQTQTLEGVELKVTHLSWCTDLSNDILTPQFDSECELQLLVTMQYWQLEEQTSRFLITIASHIFGKGITWFIRQIACGVQVMSYLP